MPAADDQALALRLHLLIEGAVHRVVLEEISEGRGVGDVVHCHELNVLTAEAGANHVAPDPAEPIDADLDAHARIPRCRKRWGKSNPLIFMFAPGESRKGT